MIKADEYPKENKPPTELPSESLPKTYLNKSNIKEIQLLTAAAMLLPFTGCATTDDAKSSRRPQKCKF